MVESGSGLSPIVEHGLIVGRMIVLFSSQRLFVEKEKTIAKSLPKTFLLYCCIRIC